MFYGFEIYAIRSYDRLEFFISQNVIFVFLTLNLFRAERPPIVRYIWQELFQIDRVFGVLGEGFTRGLLIIDCPFEYFIAIDNAYRILQMMLDLLPILFETFSQNFLRLDKCRPVRMLIALFSRKSRDQRSSKISFLSNKILMGFFAVVLRSERYGEKLWKGHTFFDGDWFDIEVEGEDVEIGFVEETGNVGFFIIEFLL